MKSDGAEMTTDGAVVGGEANHVSKTSVLMKLTKRDVCSRI